VHDVGKIGVPDAVLFKPGPLTPQERARIQEHPVLGSQILADVLGVEQLGWVRHHHERFGGGGYPLGLRGEEIPLAARIFAIADSFDAMTSDRPYRSALSTEDAVAEICAGSGTQFDPNCVEAFQVLAAEDDSFVRRGRILTPAFATG